MQQYLTYLCTDINEIGPSLVIFLRVDQFYVLRFLFCQVYDEWDDFDFDIVNFPFLDGDVNQRPSYCVFL